MATPNYFTAILGNSIVGHTLSVQAAAQKLKVAALLHYSKRGSFPLGGFITNHITGIVKIQKFEILNVPKHPSGYFQPYNPNLVITNVRLK